VEHFAALADPTRRQIVEVLARGPLSSGQIAERFPITRPAISQHLNALRSAGLVRRRADGQRRIYELDSAGIDALGAWVEGIRRFWGPRLDALEAQLRKDEP
jgi:DNA-binding transcriptional ArsR family regulator